MRLSRVLPVAVILLSLTLLALLSTDTSRAVEFAPGNPAAVLSDTTPSANPDLATVLNIKSASSNFTIAATYVPASFGLATDAAITDGAVVGTVNADVTTLGILNAGCFTPVSPFFNMMDATTDFITSGAVDPAKLITPDGPAGDRLRNLVQDDDNDGNAEAADSDNIPNHVDHFPSYLITLIDPDGPGGALPIVPRARYTGFDVVSDVTVVLQFLVFNPGDLRALPAGGAAIPGLGYPSFTVLQDPTLAPNNSAITDFCTNLGSTTTLFGEAHDNDCTPTAGAGCTTTIAGDTLFQAVDGGCNAGTSPNESGWNGSSCDDRLTNPASVQTVQFTLQARSARDFDGDGIENSLDACNRTWSDPDGVPDTTTSDHFKPRASTDTANDFDGDGLDKSCDPDDTTFNDDQDADGWKNRLDNCAVSVRNGGAFLRQNTHTIRERYVDDSSANGTFDSGESIYLDGGTLGQVGAGDLLVDGASKSNGTTLVPFPTAAGVAIRHLDTNWTGGEGTSRAGVYKRSFADADEGIYLDLDDSLTVSAGDTLIQGPSGSNGDLLIGWMPARHVVVDNTSGFLNGDDITVGPRSQEGGADTEIDRNDYNVVRSGVDGILSYEHDTSQPLINATESLPRPTGDTVAVKFAANVNRGQADFDIPLPFQVSDGGTRGDTIGPSSAADVGCETGTDGDSVPDGHYHRTATISRVCITSAPGTDDVDGDGVCNAVNAVTGLIDPNDGNVDSDGDNGTGEGGGAVTNCVDGSNNDPVGDLPYFSMTDASDPECSTVDTVDNCISISNAAPSGFTQADKDTDGIGDACDTFHDSDGDGFSDRLENAAEEGTFCGNTIDDDSDGAVNDGCPRAGPAEATCGASGDNDTDTFDNDGCPSVGTVSAGTLALVHCAGPTVPSAGNARTSPSPANSHPTDLNGDNFTDISDIGLLAADFGLSTGAASLGERGDIAPDAPSALGGGIGDAFIDISDIGVAAANFGLPSC